MEFSNALKEGGPWAWSPDGTFLAACDSSRLVVRDTKTLMVVSVFSNLDVCNVVEWSRDGRYILCAMYKRGIVQVNLLVPGGMGWKQGMCAHSQVFSCVFMCAGSWRGGEAGDEGRICMS